MSEDNIQKLVRSQNPPNYSTDSNHLIVNKKLETSSIINIYKQPAYEKIGLEAQSNFGQQSSPKTAMKKLALRSSQNVHRNTPAQNNDSNSNNILNCKVGGLGQSIMTNNGYKYDMSTHTSTRNSQNSNSHKGAIGRLDNN